MEQKSVKWGEHPWDEIRRIAEAGAVAVAPFGSTEQHGPMLPVDTDIRIAEKVSNDGAEVALKRHGVPVLVMPTMPFGLALHHMGFAGTVSLQPETYVAAVAQILGCAVSHGFRKIAVISGHGGNVPGLQLGIQKVVHQSPRSLRVALFQGHSDAEFSRISREIHKDAPPEGQMGIHASRWETSEALADRPHLVRREKMVRPELKMKSVPEWSWKTQELSETGAFGDPSLANAGLGEKMWRAWAEAVGAFIQRLWKTELPD